MSSQKLLAVVGAALTVFGVACPPSFVLGVELLVIAALMTQIARFPMHLPRFGSLQGLRLT
jgi:hypothetical protein